MAVLGTYAYGQTPLGVVEVALPRRYEMKLHRDYMVALVYALGQTTRYEDVGLASVAMDLRTRILKSLGIEEA